LGQGQVFQDKKTGTADPRVGAGLGTGNFYFQDKNFEISGHFSGHQNDVFTLK